MNFKVAITEMYQRISWELVAGQFAGYTLGTTVLIKWNDSQCTVLQPKLFVSVIYMLILKLLFTSE